MLQWALVELSRHPEKQQRLRRELLDAFSTHDPTHDDFMAALPYLDSILRETLRLHPPVTQLVRIVSLNPQLTLYLSHQSPILFLSSKAEEDDILPLGTQIKDASGASTEFISVAKGQQVITPIRALNCSEALWGPDAAEFSPERWLDNEKGLTEEAKAIQGYHHMFTFGDGPRICIGRAFASAEFKVRFIRPSFLSLQKVC